MKNSIVFFLLFAALSGHAQDNQLTSKEKKDGWQLLFDGVSKKGWHAFKNGNDASAWKVENGILYLDGTMKTGRGDLVTDGEYENYHLKFDFKIPAKGNSGLIFMVQDREPYQATWHTGPEYQFIDNINYPAKLDPRQMTASLYDLIATPVGDSHPAGEWNSGEIILKGNSLEFKINGKTCVKTTLWSEEWNTMVKGSKFISEKDFAKKSLGHIAIQDHNARVEMKNIKIKSL